MPASSDSSGAGTMWRASSGSFADYSWAPDSYVMESSAATPAPSFLEYIDGDCQCPTRRKVDQYSAGVARIIYNYLRHAEQIDPTEHRDLIFEAAQKLVRIIGIEQ